MRQELRTWRSEAGSRRWLSALIAAMDEASQPAHHPIDDSTLDQFRAHLSLPASVKLHQPSTLRH
jgi:hypothetical protein